MDKANCFLHGEPLLAQPPLYLRGATEWGLVDWGGVGQLDVVDVGRVCEAPQVGGLNCQVRNVRCQLPEEAMPQLRCHPAPKGAAAKR